MNKQRQSIRLKKYDYSKSGMYFVTICTQNRQCLFGEIVGANHDSPVPKMKLNEFGKIVDNILNSLPKRFSVVLDEFQIMPNHVHMIINIIVGAHHDAPVYKRAIHESPLRRRSLLSKIIGYFKMNSAKLIHQINPNIPVWQRNYYEHIIRYFICHPAEGRDPVWIPSFEGMTWDFIWDRDRNNPINIKHGKYKSASLFSN